MNTQLPSEESIHATAAQILFDEGHLDAISLLLACEFAIDPQMNPGEFYINLQGPYLTLRNYMNFDKPLDETKAKIKSEIMRVVNTILPPGFYVSDWIFTVNPAPINKNWREELLSAIQGGEVHNQSIGFNTESKIKIYEGLRYRSESEVKIAQALDKVGALFLPNCRARVGASSRREIREPDFLIFHVGKWGILEVDGETYHPPSRAAQDHARDRLFLDHGKILIEHFDAKECYNSPDAVVGRFLKHLAQS